MIIELSKKHEDEKEVFEKLTYLADKANEDLEDFVFELLKDKVSEINICKECKNDIAEEDICEKCFIDAIFESETFKQIQQNHGM